jgi:hypothetical protein
MVWLTLGIVFGVCALIGMGLAWVFGLRSGMWLLSAAALAGTFVGGWLAQAGSAMASAVSPRDALIKGALRGMLISALCGILILAIVKLFRSRF